MSDEMLPLGLPLRTIKGCKRMALHINIIILNLVGQLLIMKGIIIIISKFQDITENHFLK
jgi:hypothetical protein